MSFREKSKIRVVLKRFFRSFYVILEIGKRREEPTNQELLLYSTPLPLFLNSPFFFHSLTDADS